MTQGAAHWLCHEGISAAKRRVVHKGRPASIDATKVAALKAEGLGAAEIAKRLKVGRSSVYRLLLGQRGWGRLNEREIATPRDGRWQTRSDASRCARGVRAKRRRAPRGMPQNQPRPVPPVFVPPLLKGTG